MSAHSNEAYSPFPISRVKGSHAVGPSLDPWQLAITFGSLYHIGMGFIDGAACLRIYIHTPIAAMAFSMAALHCCSAPTKRSRASLRRRAVWGSCAMASSSAAPWLAR